jgi:hypothetical protein
MLSVLSVAEELAYNGSVIVSFFPMDNYISELFIIKSYIPYEKTVVRSIIYQQAVVFNFFAKKRNFQSSPIGVATYLSDRDGIF